jgi:hypothetical protein
MKKIFTLFLISSVLFVACSKDDDSTPNDNNNPPPPSNELTVQKKNRAAIIYFGEDWCPPCGSYGGPTLDSLLEREEGDLLTGIKINRSSNNSSLNWAVGTTMWGPFNSGVFNNASAIPSMAVCNVKQSISTNIVSNTNAAITKVNTFNSDTVIAGVAMRKSFVGDSIKVETKVKFFEAIPAGDDYHLAIYLVEDNVVANQSMSSGGPDPDYVNRNLVRSCNASTYTGVTINNDLAVTKNKEFKKTFKIYVKPTWDKPNLKVVAVIWKIGATPATVINSNVID